MLAGTKTNSMTTAVFYRLRQTIHRAPLAYFDLDMKTFQEVSKLLRASKRGLT